MTATFLRVAIGELREVELDQCDSVEPSEGVEYSRTSPRVVEVGTVPVVDIHVKVRGHGSPVAFIFRSAVDAEHGIVEVERDCSGLSEGTHAGSGVHVPWCEKSTQAFQGRWYTFCARSTYVLLR